MKKVGLLMVLFVTLLTACSNSEVKLAVAEKNIKAVLIDDGSNIKVHIPEDLSDIEFIAIGIDKVKVDVSLEDGYYLEKLLITDGEEFIRLFPSRGEFILTGKKLDTFKLMAEKSKDISLKGKISNYNYYAENISSDDVEVINLIFGERKNQGDIAS